jgi:hypothetical protein
MEKHIDERIVMRTYFECLPCFVNQALGALKSCDATDNQKVKTMQSVFSELAGIDYDATPPVTAQKIHRMISKTVGIKDPYAHQKQHFNKFAVELLASIKKTISSQQDIFSVKVKLAIAANIIDFGKNNNLSENDVLSCFEKAMEVPLDSVALADLKDSIHDADSILFLCDNAGEIVFDRFLIEELPFKKVICAVRGAPVINDATLDDARVTGLTEIVRVISNGSDAPGTVIEDCSPEFRHVFDEADVIIAKGQGNFETLSGITNRKIYFLFQVKCPVVGRDTGYPVGSFLILDNQLRDTRGVLEGSQSGKIKL